MIWISWKGVSVVSYRYRLSYLIGDIGLIDYTPIPCSDTVNTDYQVVSDGLLSLLLLTVLYVL